MASTSTPTSSDRPEAGAASTSSSDAASTSTSTSASSLRRRLHTIHPAQDHLYLRLPSGIVKYIKPSGAGGAEGKGKGPAGVSGAGSAASERKPKVVSLGKFGSFDLNELEGVPYGWTWEIGPPRGSGSGAAGDAGEDAEGSSGGGKRAREGEDQDGAAASKKPGKKSRGAASTPGSLRIMVNSTLAELDAQAAASHATNEDIFDDPSVAPRLTTVDIEALKARGLRGQELIDEMTRVSSSFEKRTAYSQDKFIKKKEAKHLSLFTPLAPSLANVASFQFEQRGPERIRGLRIDALAQMLSFGGVAPGGRYLVVDGTGGLLTGACLERMGGQGALFFLHDNEAAPELDVLQGLNLPHDECVQPVLRVLQWAQTEREYVHPYIPPVPERLPDALREQKDAEGAAGEGLKAWRARERERNRNLKRRAAQRAVDALRSDFFSGDFDALLVASPYEPVSIIEALAPYLAGSANVAVHAPVLQPLVEAHAILRASDRLCNLSITEPWLRRYQVLPGRTHPEMQTSATGGYILHGIRVLTEEEVQRVMAEAEGERQTENEETQRKTQPQTEMETETETEVKTEKAS